MVELQPERVTVAIPAYNAASTLDETLLSVRRQSYPELEILVIDDGSTDATAAIAQRHAAVDARVTLVANRMAAWPRRATRRWLARQARCSQRLMRTISGIPTRSRIRSSPCGTARGLSF